MKINFPIRSNLIVASHISGVYDVNRSTTLANDDFELIKNWVKSVEALGIQGIIFHNNFSEETIKQHQSEWINFVQVDYNPQFNPNVFRYSAYADFLNHYADEIKNVFFTDVSDVEVLKSPFTEDLYLKNAACIFCGDEQKTLENDWMINHSEHLRSKIHDYANYEKEFKSAPLLNCGIMGGNILVMKPFINQLWEIHHKHNHDNKTTYTGDMGAFNYLVRTKYNSFLIHGTPVNTVFKRYIYDDLCWFKHK